MDDEYDDYCGRCNDDYDYCDCCEGDRCECDSCKPDYTERIYEAWRKAEVSMSAALIDATEWSPPFWIDMWWVPMLPLPDGMTIQWDKPEYEDITWPGNSMQSIVQVRGDRYWLELPDGRSFKVTSIMWGFADGDWGPDGPKPGATAQLIAVRAPQPPDFGWWMPSLKEV